jgi:hypothetical protein
VKPHSTTNSHRRFSSVITLNPAIPDQVRTGHREVLRHI